MYVDHTRANTVAFPTRNSEISECQKETYFGFRSFIRFARECHRPDSSARPHLSCTPSITLHHLPPPFQTSTLPFATRQSKYHPVNAAAALCRPSTPINDTQNGDGKHEAFYRGRRACSSAGHSRRGLRGVHYLRKQRLRERDQRQRICGGPRSECVRDSHVRPQGAPVFCVYMSSQISELLYMKH